MNHFCIIYHNPKTAKDTTESDDEWSKEPCEDLCRNIFSHEPIANVKEVNVNNISHDIPTVFTIIEMVKYHSKVGWLEFWARFSALFMNKIHTTPKHTPPQRFMNLQQYILKIVFVLLIIERFETAQSRLKATLLLFELSLKLSVDPTFHLVDIFPSSS